MTTASAAPATPQRRRKEEEEETIEEEEEEVMLGFTLGEIMLTANALASFSLSYMSILSRSANLPYSPPGTSFLMHARNTLLGESSTTSLFGVLPGFADLFFGEAANTRGGKLVFESLFALFCAGAFTFQLEMSRKHNVMRVGHLLAYLAFAIMPVFCQAFGVGVCFPLSMVWLSKIQRSNPTIANNSALDWKKTILAFASLAAFVLLQTKLFASGEIDLFWLLPFLIAPLLPGLFGLAFFAWMGRDYALNETRLVQIFCGVLAMAGFLLVGTFGVSIHTKGFGQFETEMREEGGQRVVDLIVKDCLSNSPSRFLFVEFVHLCICCITYSMMKMRGSGGLGLILFVTTLVGPTGSFALLAAHNEFRLMKDRKLF